MTELSSVAPIQHRMVLCFLSIDSLTRTLILLSILRVLVIPKLAYVVFEEEVLGTKSQCVDRSTLLRVSNVSRVLNFEMKGIELLASSNPVEARVRISLIFTEQSMADLDVEKRDGQEQTVKQLRAVSCSNEPLRHSRVIFVAFAFQVTVCGRSVSLSLLPPPLMDRATRPSLLHLSLVRDAVLLPLSRERASFPFHFANDIPATYKQQ